MNMKSKSEISNHQLLEYNSRINPPGLELNKSGMEIRKRLSKIILAASTVEGIIVLVFLFREPSKSAISRWFVFSSQRAVLGLVALLVMAPLAVLTWKAWRKPGWIEDKLGRLERWLAEKNGCVPLLFGVGILGLAAAGMVVLFRTGLAEGLLAFIKHAYPGTGPAGLMLQQGGYDRLEPLLVWLVLLCGQGLVILLAGYPHIISEKWKSGAIGKAFFITLILAATLAHWVILSFQMDVFFRIPGWKWYFYKEVFRPSHLLFIPILLAVVAGVWYVVRSTGHAWRKLALLIVLGYVLQVGMGFVQGQGYESIRLKYADSVFNGYAKVAAAEPGLVDTLTHYESLYQQDHYLGTKPPGTLLPYFLTEKVAQVIMPAAKAAGRFTNLTMLGAYVFPAIAMLVLPVLYLFSKKLLGQSDEAVLPAVLYITCANVVLIPTYMDQVLYPLVAMLILLLLYFAIQRQSILLAVAVGAACNLAIYLTFSLTPLIPLAGLWLVIDYLMHRKERKLLKTAWLALGMAAGWGVVFLILWAALNYNFFLRFPNAIVNHRTTMDVVGMPSLQQMLGYSFLNTVEFLVWTGIPLAIIFISVLVKMVRAFVQKKVTPLHGLMGAFIITFLALGLLGQTRGEVMRLWLFFVPLVCLFIAQDVSEMFKRRQWGFLFLTLLQLVTLFLTFKFQDFYG